MKKEEKIKEKISMNYFDLIDNLKKNITQFDVPPQNIYKQSTIKMSNLDRVYYFGQVVNDIFCNIKKSV